MKLNKKIIIPAFSLLAGVSLVGSISGTIAWYQYSTRANVSYIGTSAGTIGNLQVRLAGGEWGTQISIQDVADYLAAQSIGQEVEPVTPGALAKDGSLLGVEWRELAVASTGDGVPDNGNGAPGDFYYDTAAGKLYLRGASEWAESAIEKAAAAPEDPSNGDKYFNTADNTVYEGNLKAEWKELAVATTAAGLPNDQNGNEGDYYFDTSANKIYRKRSQAWAEVTMSILDAAPAKANVGQKYFNTTDSTVYEGASLQKDFYLNPQINVGPYSKWLKASVNNYVKIPLQLRFMEQSEEHLNAEDVFLSKLVLQEDRHNDDISEHGDISEALRVHFSAYEEGDEANAVNHLVSKNGGTMLTHGRLRLGNGADFDKAYNGADEFGFDDGVFDYVYYGGREGVQTSFKAAVDGVQKAYYYEEEFGATGWKEVSVDVDAGLPDNGDGEQGDFYIDNESDKLYQKGASEWAESSDYISGAADPDLDTERNGKNYYVKTGSHKLFLCGAVEEAISPILVGPSDDANKPLKLTETTDKAIGQTVATRADDSEPQKYLNVDVTIWVEGWHKFNRGGSYTSLWDRDLIDAMFDVGIQFAVQDR